MKMEKMMLTAILLGLLFNVRAQTNSEKAIELKNQAIELMDKGEIDKSLTLLKQAQELDPDNINIPYEIAYSYQLAKEYDKSIETAKPLLKHPDVFDQVYQLIGNCYDMKGDKKKAIQSYNKGLKKFPNSGKLYLEKGLVLASQDKWDEALLTWESGIVAEPAHSSNYYYATQILAQTDEKIWGVYYGEIFLNLESNTQRTKQISKLVYDAYKLCLPITDNKWGLAFSLKATNIVIGDIKKLKLSFETVHNLAMGKGFKNVNPEFTIDNLIAIRKQFLTSWNEDYAERYPNVLFRYYNKLVNNNMFDAYFYWLLKDGAPDEFNSWKSKNQTGYDNFLAWYNENPVIITDDNKTHRFSYEQK